MQIMQVFLTRLVLKALQSGIGQMERYHTFPFFLPKLKIHLKADLSRKEWKGSFYEGWSMGRQLTTLTMAQGARLKKNQEIEPISFLQVHWALQKRCAPWKGSRHRGGWQTGESACTMQTF